MSPFVVSTDKDAGYVAANTLAGSRLNTSLFQTPVAISVLNKELLDDLGAENTRDFLKFATNADQDDGAQAVGQNTQYSDVVVKIRGFTGGGLTRDYFGYGGGVLSDRFNVERVDLSRGPNAVLYGIGGPGGVINMTTKPANIGGRQKVASVTVGSYGKRRNEADLALPVVRNKLALRVNGMMEERDGWREFEFVKSRGGALAASYKPFNNTWVRASWERVYAKQNIPWAYPVQDFGGTRWLAAGAKLTSNVLPGTNPDPSTLQAGNNYAIMYAPQIRPQPFRLMSAGPDMRPDVAGVQAAGFWQTANGATSPVGGVVDDPSFGTAIPRKANIMGSGSRADYDYTVGSIFLEQQLGHLAVELAYNNVHYSRYNMIITTGLGLRADPNAVLPGAYVADGSWDSRTGLNPGTLLPDIGVANRSVGRLYAEGTAGRTWISTDIEAMRASLSYKLDLTKKSKWLGRHTFAGLAQSQETFSLVKNATEYNAGATDGLPVEHSSHQVWRRTYFDFSSPNGTRGALDPMANPVPAGAGVNVQWLLANAAPVSRFDVDTQMMALQSAFLNDRVVVTAGYRWDDQISQTATAGGVRVPNSSTLWLKHHDAFVRTTSWSLFSGQTRTLGLFFAPFKWLGLTANKSDSVLPQSAINILHQTVTTRSGKGQDFGVRFNLLEGRVYANANIFTNDDTNRVTFYNILAQQYNPPLNAIVTTQKLMGQPLPKVMRDAGTTDLVWTGSERDLVTAAGKGFEIELVGNITRGWSISFNFAQNTVAASGPGFYSNAFYRDVQGDWDNNNTPLSTTPAIVADFVRNRDRTPNRDFTLSPATFNDAYDFAGEVLKGVNASEGRPELMDVRNSCNFFTSYRFDPTAPVILKGMRIGAGGNRRSAPVIGYDALNGNATLYGKGYFHANVMVGRKIPLKNGRWVDVQLNIDNALDQDDMMPYSAVTAGSVVRYIYPRTHRAWNLRVQYGF